MSDETVKEGERVIASGGDRIFPKGFPIGTITKVGKGPDLFLSVQVKPAANLRQLEEVLVVSDVEYRAPELKAEDQPRAADIRAQRLPTFKKKQEAPEGAGKAVTAPTREQAPPPQRPQATPPSEAGAQPNAAPAQAANSEPRR
jgi:rod shape-determining protein MreC